MKKIIYQLLEEPANPNNILTEESFDKDIFGEVRRIIDEKEYKSAVECLVSNNKLRMLYDYNPDRESLKYKGRSANDELNKVILKEVQAEAEKLDPYEDYDKIDYIESLIYDPLFAGNDPLCRLLIGSRRGYADKIHRLSMSSILVGDLGYPPNTTYYLGSIFIMENNQ